MKVVHLVAHRFPIGAYQQAFILAETGQHQAVKVVIVF